MTRAHQSYQPSDLVRSMSLTSCQPLWMSIHRETVVTSPRTLSTSNRWWETQESLAWSMMSSTRFPSSMVRLSHKWQTTCRLSRGENRSRCLETTFRVPWSSKTKWRERSWRSSTISIYPIERPIQLMIHPTFQMMPRSDWWESCSPLSLVRDSWTAQIATQTRASLPSMLLTWSSLEWRETSQAR